MKRGHPIVRGGVEPVAKPNPLLEAFGEISELTATLRSADRRRNEAVAEARRLGGSWSQIARAADMTPQGAHGRWRET